MIDLLFHVTLNNVCISLALAIAAMTIGVTLKRPAITYLMWLLVFLKLLTPPVVSIAVLPGSWMEDTVPLFTSNIDAQMNIQEAQVSKKTVNADLLTATESASISQGKLWLFLTWLLGSMVVFLRSLFHVYRFNNLLGKESEAGTQEIQSMAADIASSLGMKSVPAVHTASANLSPMVWWAGGKVWVVIPTVLIERLDRGHLRWILSHELAHVRRRDYMVRWIEWLACVCFWWNPVAWWARNSLRANEELCCDALVLSRLNPRPSTYGDSLLKAIEILAYPACRPTAMASGINGGRLLKRRVSMIVSKNLIRSNLCWLQACILLAALVVLPIGLTNAQVQNAENEPQKVKSDLIEQQEIKAAVQQVQEAMEIGRISEEEAKARLDELEQQAAQKLKSRMLADLDREIARTEAGLAALSKTHAPNHPDVIRLSKELDYLFAQRLGTPNMRIFKTTAPQGKLNVPYPGIDYAAVIKDMVEDGMLSEEYVEDKLAEYENARYERFVRALEEAVLTGKITQEEAAAMTAEYIERMEAMRAKRQLGRQ